MGVATSTGNHSNSTSPHRNKAPTRLVTGPSKNWGWNRSTPLSITSAPPPCCGSQGSQQPSGGNPTFSTIFGSFFLLWQRAQKKGSSRISGECCLDLEEEVLNVTVAVSHALDDLDTVVDPFELARMHGPTHSRQNAWPVFA